jgi:cation transport regulator ChaC
VSADPDETVLYFAYGSNMSTPRLAKRLGPLPRGRVAQLKGYRIAFNKRGDRGGKTNIVPGAANDVVPGVVYALTRRQFETLSDYEHGYAKEQVSVEIAGQGARPWTFIAERTEDGLKPSRAYRQHLIDGAREYGLDLHALSLEAIEVEDDPPNESLR